MSDKRQPVDVLIAQVAARQHGLVTLGQLRELGLDREKVGYRHRAGRLHRIRRGVYAVGHARLTREARFLAAVLDVGPGAVLSHASAAVQWGFLEDRPNLGRDVHVTCARHVRPRRGTRVHTARRLDCADVTRAAGIPITTPARTLLDLADAASDPVLRRAVRQAEVERQVNPARLRAQLARAPAHQRGTRRLRALIEPGPAPTRSELEDRVLELLLAHGLPRPLINPTLEGLPRRTEVDFLFADHGLIIEADGARYHDTRLAREADATKQAMLESAGYRVVRVNWSQVTREADQTVRRLRRILSRSPPSGRSAPGPPRRRPGAP